MRPLLAILAVLLVAGTAAAHGGVEPREIDERVLADGTSNGDYGSGGVLDDGGIDILSLDLRVATIPGTAAEAVVARVIAQGGDAGEHRIEMTLAGNVYAWTTSDLAAFAADGFAAVAGPFPVGDGHSFALEGYIPVSALGWKSGEGAADITVTSMLNGDKADEMPGSWYYQGQEVPSTENTVGAGSYIYGGLPDWFTFTADTNLIQGDTEIQLAMGSALETMDQEVRLSVIAPFGLEVALDKETVLLVPGESRNATLSVSGFATGDVQVVAESNLAGARVITIPIQGDAEVGNGGGIAGPLLNTGEAYQYRFTTPAVFEYHCHPHPFMVGTITIVEDDPIDEPVTHIVKIADGSEQEAYGFFPGELTVQVNDTVVWLNEGAFQHNVHGSTGIAGDGHDHDHDHDHDHGAEDDEQSPGVPLVLLAAMLLAITIRRR